MKRKIKPTKKKRRFKSVKKRNGFSHECNGFAGASSCRFVSFFHMLFKFFFSCFQSACVFCVDVFVLKAVTCFSDRPELSAEAH